jgi:hypothetical protein
MTSPLSTSRGAKVGFWAHIVRFRKRNSVKHRTIRNLCYLDRPNRLSREWRALRCLGDREERP